MFGLTPDQISSVALLIQAFVALFLLYFTLRQTQINSRMQVLSDYVAAFIAPAGSNSSDGLNVKNVGKVNVYIHKWEVGTLSTSFLNALLLPVDSSSGLVVPIPPNLIGVHVVKLYLKDEGGKKYLSTGQIIIQAIPVGIQVPNVQSPGVITSPPQMGGMTSGNTAASIQMVTPMTAQSFKTEPYNWTI